MSILPTILLLAAQTTGPGPDRVVLTGAVVDAEGKPAVGVRIALADDVPRFTGAVAVRAAAVVFPPAAVLRGERADAAGRFRVELPEPEWMLLRFGRPFFLWAIGPGGSMAMRPIPGRWPADGVPVRMAMARPEALRFLVLDAEDRPAAGVRLAPDRIRGAGLPDELAGPIAVATDAQGRATLAVGAADEIEVIRATSSAIGMQRLRMPRAGADGVRTIRLLPVGRVVGRVEAGDPSAVRGLAVRVRTDPDPGDFQAGVGGFAAVVTDDRGRFEVPAIAVGTLSISIEHRQDLPWRGGMTGRPAVEPGSTADDKIPLRRATRARGIVRSVPDGRPVAGADVRVNISPGILAPFVTTDAEGRYSAFIAGPGLAHASVAVPPRGYCFLTAFNRNARSVAEGTAEVEMDPIELGRSVEVRGRVVDAKGNPVPTAEVAGYFDIGDSIGIEVHTLSDREGRFRLVDLPPGSTVRLSASRGDATTAAPAAISAGDGPVTLTIGPEHAIALIGRVKDPADRPIAGAAVRVSARKVGRFASFPAEQFTVAFDDEGRTIVRTGPDGRFRTPRHLRPDLEYRIDVEADGYATTGSEWIPASDRAFRSFAPVVLRPVATTRTVTGRVVDSGGRPVAGVVVFQSGDGPARTRTTTGADGRFRLPGVYREPAFLFVEGDGFAFEGHRIGPGDERVELKARRVGEPAGPPLRTLPPLLPRAKEIALARRLIGDDLGPLTDPNSNRRVRTLLHALPRVDLDRARDLLETHAIRRPSLDQSLRAECAQVLSATDLDQAAAIAEELPQPFWRSIFYRLASDALPETDRAGKLALLDKAIVQARAETAAERKLGELGLIGYRLLDLGQNGRAAELLREGQKVAATLPRLTLARGRFAPKLARIDAPAAIAMAQESDRPGNDRSLLGVALALADRDPAGSERLFARAANGPLRGLTIVRAVSRMAPIDRERARRLAETVTPLLQVRALGAMAASLSAIDPKAAAAMIDEALRRLERPEGTGGERYASQAAAEAGNLLPTAERIDPELLRRCFWKAVALRPPRPAAGDPTGAHEFAISDLAITLARYDRAAARQVLEPAAARIRSVAEPAPVLRRIEVFAAAAAIDPVWAAALADSLPDDTPGASNRPKADARQAIADAIADEGPARWDHLAESYLPFRVDSRDDE